MEISTMIALLPPLLCSFVVDFFLQVDIFENSLRRLCYALPHREQADKWVMELQAAEFDGKIEEPIGQVADVEAFCNYST